MLVFLIPGVSLGLSLVMVFAWILQRRLGNAGWVDAVWSFGTGAAGVAYALAPLGTADWPAPRQTLVALVVALWSLRLGLHLADRSRRGPEDTRYARLRVEWGADFERRLFWFLQAQAVASMILTLSILVAAANPAPIGPTDLLALAIMAAAIIGEGVADAQLRSFRLDPANHGRICDRGLWSLSRHPNYFFEWLIWVAYPVFALGGGWWWLALTGPAAMYWLLVHVSGIPLLEAQMLRSRGDAYRLYQARTRAFLPLPLWRRS
jgi:steroid 5-alpha reductase family enzyme